MLTDDQITTWQAELEQARTKPEWAEGDPIWNTYRTPEVIGALENHLQRYLDGDVSLPVFQSTFDKNTRTVWDGFGLKGMSGAMFLNTLVKYMPHQQAVDQTLKQVLPVPSHVAAARGQMARLVNLVDAATASGAVAKTQVQSSRAAFFLSAWWHIQKREQWPVYYVSMRSVFERHGVWKAQQSDIVEDYFEFRDTALALTDALNAHIWDLERLCLWLDGAARIAESEPPSPPATNQPDTDQAGTAGSEQEMDGTMHTQVQLLLAKLGRKFNCKVWIAQNDHGKQWNGEKLGSYSIPSLPTLGIGDPAQSIVRMIDVIWLKGVNQVVASFEVEHTTSIYSGLLRMSDLTVLAPNTHFPIYIVSPEIKLEKVRDQLKRPTFQRIGLHERTRFFSTEQLIANIDAMLKWSNDAGVINKLAEQVGDIDDASAIPEDE